MKSEDQEKMETIAELIVKYHADVKRATSDFESNLKMLMDLDNDEDNIGTEIRSS